MKYAFKTFLSFRVSVQLWGMVDLDIPSRLLADGRGVLTGEPWDGMKFDKTAEEVKRGE